jgi:hypothetical protein
VRKRGLFKGEGTRETGQKFLDFYNNEILKIK